MTPLAAKRQLELLDAMHCHAPGSAEEFAALLGWTRSTVVKAICQLTMLQLVEQHSRRMAGRNYVNLYAPVLHGAPAPKPPKPIKTRPSPAERHARRHAWIDKIRAKPVTITASDPWGRPLDQRTI